MSYPLSWCTTHTASGERAHCTGNDVWEWAAAPEFIGAFLVAQTVKRLSAMQETWVRPLGWGDPLEKEMAAHSSILAWKIPWTVEPGRLPSRGSQRVGHNWARCPPFLQWSWSSWSDKTVEWTFEDWRSVSLGDNILLGRGNVFGKVV